MEGYWNEEMNHRFEETYIDHEAFNHLMVLHCNLTAEILKCINCAPFFMSLK